MSAIVVMLAEDCALPSKDNSGSALTPIRYLVTNVAVNENPLEVMGVPSRGSQIMMFGETYTCDRVDTPERISDSAYQVRAWFSTDGRFEVLNNRIAEDTRNFERTYKKVDISAPSFVREWWTHINAETGRELSEMTWRREDLSFPIEWMVLSINVVIEANSDSDILSILARTDLQVGRMHIFPYNPGQKWVMLPCEIRRLGKKISISYAWQSDPGNCAIEARDEHNAIISDLIMPPARKPFHIYNVLSPEDGLPSTPPRIITVNLFPTENNPYYDPTGWQTLPGNPI